jgi:hypothetical protein
MQEVSNRGALGRGLAALLAGIAALAAAVAMMGSPATASAAQESFCTWVSVAPGAACANNTYRKITRVNAKSINGSLCAGAFNSNGVQIGGWVCTVEVGEASNGNYDGTKFLKGAVYNNAPANQLVQGLEYYNP